MFAFLSLALLASIGLSSAQTGYSTTEYVGTFNGATYKGSSCKAIGFLPPLVSGSNECTPCPVGMFMGKYGLACRSYCVKKSSTTTPASREYCLENGRDATINTYTGLWTSSDGLKTNLSKCSDFGEITPYTGINCIKCGDKLTFKKDKNVCRFKRT